MERVPEPELMDDDAQAAAYAAADFDEPDARFVDGFVERFGGALGGAMIDLGCGPGNVTLRLAAALPAAHLVGVDGSAPMLAWARERAARAPQLAARVRWCRARIPSAEVPAGPFAAVVSNSLLHHLHDPSVLWAVTAQLGEPGAAVYVGDLRRPASPGALRALVAQHAADAPEVLRRDFAASLRAAFTPDEVRAQLHRAGLDALEVAPVGDRHLLVWGRLPA
jgi:SAM-dependent methyltransferase